MIAELPVIGITQRVVEVDDYDEVRDCLDHAWFSLLDASPLTPVALPNRHRDIARYCSALDVRGFILTGGNDLSLDVYPPGTTRRGVSLERDTTETAILDFAIAHRLPVLGVCRGLQFIQAYFGGDLIALRDGAVDHVATTHRIELVDGEEAVDGLVVNSYHDFGIARDGLAEPLRPLATCAADDTIEAARHHELPIVGIMWHPERSGPEPWFHQRLLHDLFTSDIEVRR